MYQFLIFLFFLLVIQTIVADGCLQVERDALLEFKAGVTDRSGRLISWRGDDCCKWAGIKCTNQTGHVIKLNLSQAYYYEEEGSYNNSLCGEISPSLHALTDLKHLDLSYNNFSGSKFPKFICSFRNLKYLDMSVTGLSGMIPQQLSNLSRLEYLDLSSNFLSGMIPPQLGNLSRLQHLALENDYSVSPSISNIQCLSHLTSLKYLFLIGVNLHDSREWVQTLNMLPSLETLILGENNLTTIPSSLSTVNFTSLTLFSLEGNHFNTLMPNWIGQLSSLKELDLFDCSFIGSIPDKLN